MYELHQTASAGDLKSNTNAVFEKAEIAPVVILSRATPKAVMVSPAYWNAVAKELQRYRARERASERAAEIDENPNIVVPFTDEELIRQGVLDG